MIVKGGRWAIAVFALSVCAARADVVYDFRTLSATLNGGPTNLTASGEIKIADAAFLGGSAQVSSTPPPPTIMYTLNGVVSASFEMFDGPTYTLGNALINFTASVDGRHLAVAPQNVGGGFFTDVGGDDAYYGVMGPGADVITIGYGSDNPGSVCFGPQVVPGARCVVTGVFEQVPEPASLVLFATAIVILTSFGRRRRRVGRGTRNPRRNSIAHAVAAHHSPASPLSVLI